MMNMGCFSITNSPSSLMLTPSSPSMTPTATLWVYSAESVSLLMALMSPRKCQRMMNMECFSISNSPPSLMLISSSHSMTPTATLWVRFSPNGVNVTVGGLLSALKKHIEAVKSNTLFQGTDFKLASSHHPLNDKVALECGFTFLSIRVVKELVTFSSHHLLKAPEVSNAGRHLSATEFHSVLQSAGKLMMNGSPTDDKQLVLLDARNLYETRIGKFDAPSLETLDRGIRQYGDLPSWIDDNSEQLRGKHVLMYCTGGIRCEMASAYIRSKGTGFENVFQLFGGIQRYLEQFPDGGFFRGKNFVFDHRIAVGSSDTNIIGTCLICGTSYDDYSSRCRCTHCRMLVLICDTCQIKSNAFVCEMCQKHRKDIGSIPFLENSEPEAVSA
ncbi:hypothetical protein REPUB_Repub16aG0150000 [Reevesia pubescens]